MKKIYMTPVTEVCDMEVEKMVCDSFKVGDGTINGNTPGVEVGAPQMPDLEESDDLFNLDFPTFQNEQHVLTIVGHLIIATLMAQESIVCKQAS